MSDYRDKNPSEEAVLKATKKGWDEWFALMDHEGCRKMNHTEMARLLRDKHGVSAWWSQTVTVAYERERGMRKVHERLDGFSVGRSRTLAINLDRLWDLLTDPVFLKEWLPDLEITITRTKPKQRIQATLTDGTSLEFATDPKGDNKSFMSAAQSRISDEKQAAIAKAAWTRRMDDLRDRVESGQA